MFGVMRFGTSIVKFVAGVRRCPWAPAAPQDSRLAKAVVQKEHHHVEGEGDTDGLGSHPVARPGARASEPRPKDSELEARPDPLWHPAQV